VGHAGTLDPMATGVLVVLLGEACKLSSYLTLADKSYEARITFGRSTDSLDAAGETDQELELASDWLDEIRLRAALASERERTEQVPPVVSAIQVGGERAHRATRRGAPPVLEPRNVRVMELALTRIEGLSAEVTLRVTKGYYVRALARDLGARLGVPAHLARLRRTASGSFHIRDAHPWPLAEPVALLSLERAVSRALPSAELTPLGEKRARAGQPLTSEDFVVPPPVEGISAWLSESRRLVALGEVREQTPRVVRGFR
jgi:tRNA pseudouridine55 synthase